MLFLWTLFDGTFSYVTPLAITKHGFSETTLGIIIGSSSIAGALFDFILSKYLKNTHFRRVYFLMFILSFVAPLILWRASSLWVFLIAMAIWGFYFDLENFGNFDFIGRKLPQAEHTKGFGIFSIFKELGYMLAPIIAGFVIGNYLDFKPFLLMCLFISFAFVMYLVVIGITRKHNKEYIEQVEPRNKNIFTELKTWRKIEMVLFPVLSLTILLNILDAFFWTLGPIIAENFSSLHPFNGLFMAAYTFPTLIVGWFVGRITNKLGKKRTAFFAFAIGCLLLSYFSMLQGPLILLGLIFLSSCFTAISWPSINGAYADYLEESPRLEREIEAVEDFSTNIGYIIGPILAGFLADHIGNANTFSALGSVGAIVAIILIFITPKKITVPGSSR